AGREHQHAAVGTEVAAQLGIHRCQVQAAPAQCRGQPGLPAVDRPPHFGLDLGADAGQFELEDVVAHDPEPAIGCPDHGDPAVAPGRDVDRGATPVAQVADAHRLVRLQAGEQLARVADPQLPAVAEDLDAVYRDHAVAAAQAGLGGAAAG